MRCGKIAVIFLKRKSTTDDNRQLQEVWSVKRSVASNMSMQCYIIVI